MLPSGTFQGKPCRTEKLPTRAIPKTTIESGDARTRDVPKRIILNGDAPDGDAPK